jgi:hypothetical protein
MYLHKRHNIIFTIFIFPGTQVFYLVDESEETGKGANTTVNILQKENKKILKVSK